MKHIDKTPYRSESGEISIVNRLQGMLKYGMSWYERVKAQDVIAAALARQLGGQFVLLQNIVLPDTQIDLPLVLIGPPGIFLVNAVHERGVFMARDDEWGTLAGDTFVPARINQVKRALTMAKVLQVYLDRLGHKGFQVDPIIMAADPGLHIDSTRPAARIVMSDALDRFALSLLQARPVFGVDMVAELENVILTGKSRPAATFAGGETMQVAGNAVFLPEEGGSGDLEFSFTDETEAAMPGAESPLTATSFPNDPRAAARPKKAKKPKQKKIMGLKPAQLGIVIALSVFLLCVLTVFAFFAAVFFGLIQIQFV